MATPCAGRYMVSYTNTYILMFKPTPIFKPAAEPRWLHLPVCRAMVHTHSLGLQRLAVCVGLARAVLPTGIQSA